MTSGARDTTLTATARAPLLPPSTNAFYQGSRLAVWFLWLGVASTIGPGLVHSFLPDGGAGVIAHLAMGDKRGLVIGMFRWEGATQLALGGAMLAVALRYQSLTALFILLMLAERGLMVLQAWVLSPAGAPHPPEAYGSLAIVPLAVVFLALALRRRQV